MHEHASPAPMRRGAFLIASLAALCLAVPVAADRAKPEEKNEASKVAKKMEKARGAAQRAEEEREALRHFQEDVAKYAALHAKQLARLRSGVESVATQKTFARAIAAKRAKAKQGDIFQPEAQPVFRRLIAEQLEGPDALAARKAILEGNPGEDPAVPVVVRVNGEYPLGASRSTVPPSVLVTLPPLPACLHYRFVGRDLVLIDALAGLIVDVLPAAAPEPATR